MPQSPRDVSPALVAVVGWLIPGAGYWLLGQRVRALAIGISILALMFLGIFFAGIRVIDVPGYDDNGRDTRVALVREKDTNNLSILVERRSSEPKDPIRVYDNPNAVWALRAHPIAEVFAKPWYIGQFMVGPANLLCSVWSVKSAAAGVARTHSRIGEIGTLYTAVAGMLNLLAIIDAAFRAGQEDSR